MEGQRTEVLQQVASNDLGSILLDDITRWSVVRCELDLAAAILCSARYFHTALLEQLQSEDASSRRPDGLPSVGQLVVTTFRGDASNTNLNMKGTVHVMEVTSMVCEVSAMRLDTPLLPQTKHGAWFADVLRVRGSSGVRPSVASCVMAPPRV